MTDATIADTETGSLIRSRRTGDFVVWVCKRQFAGLLNDAPLPFSCGGYKPAAGQDMEHGTLLSFQAKAV